MNTPPPSPPPTTTPRPEVGTGPSTSKWTPVIKILSSILSTIALIMLIAWVVKKTKD